MLPSGSWAVIWNEPFSGTFSGQIPSSVNALGQREVAADAHFAFVVAERLGLERLGRLGQVFRLALGHASVGPAYDAFHLLGRQRLIVAELAESLDRAPGGMRRRRISSLIATAQGRASA